MNLQLKSTSARATVFKLRITVKYSLATHRSYTTKVRARLTKEFRKSYSMNSNMQLQSELVLN